MREAGTDRGCGDPTARRRLVPVHADGLAPVRAVLPPVAQHPHVPHLVTDLADPRLAAAPLVPEVRQRRHEEVARVRHAGLPVRLPRGRSVADVVAGDPVLERERARADRRVRARGHGGERPHDGVAVVRALTHQPLEVGPLAAEVVQHVPAAAVEDERHDDLRRRGCGAVAEGACGSPGSVRPARSAGQSSIPMNAAAVGAMSARDDALGVVLGDDAARGVDDERNALEVHPGARVAGARVLRHEAEGFIRVVRAVEGREQELEVPGAPGMVGVAHELHVLGAHVAGHRLLDGASGGTRSLAGAPADGRSREGPHEPRRTGDRQEPATARVRGSRRRTAA